MRLAVRAKRGLPGWTLRTSAPNQFAGWTKWLSLAACAALFIGLPWLRSVGAQIDGLTLVPSDTADGWVFLSAVVLVVGALDPG